MYAYRCFQSALDFDPMHFCADTQVKEWYSRLYQKPANFELSEEDNRQFMYDLEGAYTEFLNALKGAGQHR